MAENSSGSSQPQPPTAAPTAKTAKTRNLVLIVIGLIIASCVIIAGGIWMTVSVATGPVVAAGDSFLTALKDGNYERAYTLSSPGLQRQLQDAQGFQRVLRVSRLPLKTWSFSSRSINNTEGQVAGTGELDDGRTVTIELKLVQTGGDWKVSGFDIQPQ